MLALIFGSAFAEADDASRLYPASACTTFVLLFFGGFEEDAAGESTPSSYEEEEEDKRVLSAAAPRLRFWLNNFSEVLTYEFWVLTNSGVHVAEQNTKTF